MVLNAYNLIFTCRYKFRDRSDIGPDSMPVCHSYNGQTKQFWKANVKRLDKVVDSGVNLGKFGREEAERRAAEAGEEFEKEQEKEKQDEMELEVSYMCAENV